MDAVTRRKLVMATRVRDFARAHPFPEAGYGTWLEHLEERLTRASTLEAQQRAGLIGARGTSRRRKDLRQTIQSGLLPHLVRVGVAAAKERPELIGRFFLPRSHANDRALATSVRAMLAEATTDRERFVRLGLAAQLLADLEGAVAAFEVIAETRNTARRDHIGARAELARVIKDIAEIVGNMDGLNRYRFRNEPDRLVVWNDARDVLGPFRTRSEDPKPGEGTTPDQGSIAPAA